MGRGLLFTNHLHVLALLAERSDVRLREVAHEVGITERATHRIIGELAAGGYVTRQRVGSRNRYHVHREAALRHPLRTQMTVGRFLDLFAQNAPQTAVHPGADGPVQPPRHLQSAGARPITGP